MNQTFTPSVRSLRSHLIPLVCCTMLSATPLLGQAQTALRSAVDAGFAPHAMAKLGGGIQGFNVDLGEELGVRLGRKIQIDAAEFSGLIPGLNSRRYDFLLALSLIHI